MSEDRKEEMKVFMELGNSMKPVTLRKLGNALSVPAKIMENTRNDPIKFLKAMREWDGFNPALFDGALGYISGSMQTTARRLKWLSNPQFKQTKSTVHSTKTFVKLLTEGLTTKEWKLIGNESSELESHSMLKSCVDKSIITKDLSKLCEFLEIIKRNDLAVKVESYKSTFQNFSKAQFHEQICQELGLDQDEEENIEFWEFKLTKHMKSENENVSVVLNESSVPIESVFTPLTVIRVKPAEERAKEGSGINEINFLRNINKSVKEKSVKVVNFQTIVTSCNPSSSPVWCLIGNPGSGKSFFCQHFAFLYGDQQMSNFRFVISVPCRMPEWHKLEEVRQEAKDVVDQEFVINWLSLSMTVGAKWSESLSRHLYRTDGEGLLIIMDGADEFTTSVPFETTLLCRILERHFLRLATILVTSRPSQWTELRLDFGEKFKIKHNFQVLGFSPKNRDLYFEKRISTLEKLKSVHQLFDRHDEIKQLALVPVNASLFTSLFNNSAAILVHTLSHLYTQLVVYIIRRQLSRMCLYEHSEVLEMSHFHPGIKECINAIGLEANQGIYERELTSDKSIPLKLEDKSHDCERLGLMHAHIKVDNFGVRVKVWTFQHLTIQEYMAAVSICNNLWRNQCYIVRYFTTSSKLLDMYRMVVRFVGGILMKDAGFITPVLCRHVLPNPLPLHDAPMYYQLYYDPTLVDVSDWKEFTESFLFLCTVIIETNSHSIHEHFAYFEKRFPYPLCLYFLDTISPNEWHCLLKSLEFVRNFQVILIRSDYVTAIQFHSLLNQLATCNVHYLALLFIEKDYAAIHSLTSILTTATLPPDTRVSISLQDCDLSSCQTSQRLFSSNNQLTGSLRLFDSEMNQQMLEELTNQFSSLQNLFYSPKSNESDWSIISQLITNHQLNGLYILDPNGHFPLTPDILSGHSSLTELVWWTEEDCYRVIPSLSSINSLAQLSLLSGTPPSPNESLLTSLIELIISNANSLRDITLSFLNGLWFDSCNSFFTFVSLCSNLMVLKLVFTQFIPEDMSFWCIVLSALNSLVFLALSYSPLQDSGMLVVCSSLAYHPAIRWLDVRGCELTSSSCVALKCLIQTLPRVRMLELSKSELSSPDSEQLQSLLQLAEECSVKIV